MKNASRSAAKEAGWRERLRDQSGSGLSVRAFCRREGLSEPSFYSWRRELDKRDRERAAQPDAGTTRGAFGAAGLVAVDVVGVLGEATLEIAIDGGVVTAACCQRAALATSENLLDSEAASC